MLDFVKAQTVWQRVCACGGQMPDLRLLHGSCAPPRRCGVTRALQLLTLLRLLHLRKNCQ